MNTLELMGAADPTGWWFGQDLAWQRRAACGKSENADSFFPGQGRPTVAFRRVCQACPVRSACLAWAVEHEEEGIWGGLTEAERKKLLNRKPNPLSVRKQEKS